jgi:acetyltransferase-like isoleucine patch superfamily enzyme
MKNKKHLFRTFFRIGFLKSIYINFRLLPFLQAIKLPIIVTRSTTIESLSGTMTLNSPVSFGLVKIGQLHTDLVSWKEGKNYLNIKGDFIVGGFIQAGVGCKVVIDKNATLSIGANAAIGANTCIICRDSIKIGSNFRAAWETQIMDTNFHYTKDTLSGKVNARTAPVVLGNNNWIGNRSSVMQGTKTNDFFIAASNSLCNKDYTDSIPPYSMVGGSPAKLLKTNIVRVLDREEKEISQLFEKSNNTFLFVNPEPRARF